MAYTATRPLIWSISLGLPSLRQVFSDATVSTGVFVA